MVVKSKNDRSEIVRQMEVAKSEFIGVRRRAEMVGVYRRAEIIGG